MSSAAVVLRLTPGGLCGRGDALLKHAEKQVRVHAALMRLVDLRSGRWKVCQLRASRKKRAPRKGDEGAGGGRRRRA